MKEIIKNYLDERAKTDELFAKSYAKENKSLDECCQYILQEAKKKAGNSNAIGIADAEVFGWAVHYYDEDDIQIGKKPIQAQVSTSAAPSAPSSKAEPKKTTKKSEKKTNVQQLDLFAL